MRGEAVVVLLAAAAAAAAVLVTAAEELHGLGDDLDRLALGAVLRRPLAPVQAAVDADRAALGQEAGAVLALRAPDGDAEVVGLVDPFTRGLAAPRVGRDAQAADRRAGLQRPKLRVARQVPGENHAIDVACRHSGWLLSRLSGPAVESTGAFGANWPITPVSPQKRHTLVAKQDCLARKPDGKRASATLSGCAKPA